MCNVKAAKMDMQSHLIQVSLQVSHNAIETTKKLLLFGLVWFGFCRLFNAKAILLEEQLWNYLTHSWKDKGVHTFPKGIFSESEHNSATGVRTRLLRFRSPSL